MNQATEFYTKYYSGPLISAIVEGCIEKAVPVDAGGSKYWNRSINSCGLGVATDSLYSIKKLVFDDNELTMDALNKILASNYENAEIFRQKILNRIPKYGNGVKEVDCIAKELVEHYSDIVRSKKTSVGTSYRPGLYSFYEPIKLMGKATAATPDGRLAGNVLSLNSAPRHGNIKNGLTAALNSITSFDHGKTDNASTIDVHLSEGVPSEIIKFINESLSEKALYTQIAVTNHEDLVGAYEKPDNYQDLMVRVTGFSARFVALDKETQKEILERSYWA